jgi:signal transduction histidine kinase
MQARPIATGSPIQGLDEAFDVRERKKRVRSRGWRPRQRRAERRGPEQETSAAEERAYDDARRRAERKVKLAGDLLWFAVITVILLRVFTVAGVIVLIVWGSALAKKAYALFFEPRLRERFVEQEVRKQVLATLSQERPLLEGEHARSLEQLSASIAHEIRNPITAAKSLVQQMEEDPTSRENVEYARVALEELHRVERSVSHLLRFARDEEMGLSELNLTDVLDSALESFRDRFEHLGVRFERRIDCESALRGDAEKLRRVLINLIGNALDAFEEAGTSEPCLEVSLGENLAGSEVWLRIKDNGPGIEPEARRRLFSPFYTSKANGTGLGLPISKKLIDAHGGSIEVESEPGAGAEFLITLPKFRESEGATR